MRNSHSRKHDLPVTHSSPLSVDKPFGFWMCRHTLVCGIVCSNVRGLVGNLSDLTMASSQYDILFCSETLVSDMRHMSELLHASQFRSPCVVVSGQDASGQWDGGIRTRWLRSISPTQI